MPDTNNLCDWCTRPYTRRKMIWGDGASGVFIQACDDHESQLERVNERALKKVTAKSRHKTKDRI